MTPPDTTPDTTPDETPAIGTDPIEHADTIKRQLVDALDRATDDDIPRGELEARIEKTYDATLDRARIADHVPTLTLGAVRNDLHDEGHSLSTEVSARE